MNDSFTNVESLSGIFNAAELQGMEFPPINWVVPGVLPEGLEVTGDYTVDYEVRGPRTALEITEDARLEGLTLHGGPIERGTVTLASLSRTQRLTLNLETPGGQQLFRQLVQTADVLVETCPPGYLEGLGLGYATLQSLRPGLIMTSTHRLW